MKRNWLFTLFIALSFCAIGFTGCGDDEDDGTGNGGDTGNSLTAGDFVVTTGGTEWKATLINATKDPNNRFTLVAEKGTESFTVRANDVLTGTYDIVLENINLIPSSYGSVVYTADPSTQIFCTSKSGEIVVSEIDATAKTISGTFNFSCDNPDLTTSTFTDGEFYKIPYNE